MSHHHEGCCKHEGQPRHEGCCKGEKSEHEHCGHGHQHEHGQCCGGRHGRGGGRRQRFFGHGELRLVILDILSRDDSHGYELIKAIENLTQGNYTPSPGVIYPTLDFLQEQSLITIREEEGGKKQIALTETGRAVAGRKPRTGGDDRRTHQSALRWCCTPPEPANEAGAG